MTDSNADADSLHIQIDAQLQPQAQLKKHHRTRKGDSEYCIPRSIFRNLTREILTSRHTKIKLLDRKAMQALQLETEQFVTDIFQLSQDLSSLSGHSTVGLEKLQAAVLIYNRYKSTHDAV